MSDIFTYLEKGNEENKTFKTKNGLFSVALDGDIENRRELIRLCKADSSLTDDESLLLSALCSFEDKNKTQLLFRLSEMVLGNASFAFIPSDESSIYCKSGISMLFIGISEDKVYLSSELKTLIALCDKYAILENCESAKISNEKIVFYNSKHKKIKKTFAAVDKRMREFNNYPIESEAFCCPAAARETCLRFVKNGELDFDYLGLKSSFLNRINKIFLIGSASSKNTALACRELFESYCLLDCAAFESEEFLNSKLSVNKATLVIAISQSSCEKSTISAVLKAKKLGAKTVGVTNNGFCALALSCDCLISPKRNDIIENSASEFISDYLSLAFFALYIGYKTNVISELFIGVSLKMAEMLFGIIQSASKPSPAFENAAYQLLHSKNVYVTCSGGNYPLCFKASQIIRERSGINALALSLSELTELDESALAYSAVFALISDNERLFITEKELKQLKEKGANVVIITSESISQELEGFENSITFNDSLPIFNPLPCISALRHTATIVQNEEGKEAV